MCTNHVLIHLALIFAQPLCMQYFHKYECEVDGSHHRLLGGSAAAAVVAVTQSPVDVHADVHADAHVIVPYLNTMFNKYSFLFAHCFCVFAHVTMIICNKFESYEIGKFFDISRVPIYFYFIFRAHYFELSMISHKTGFDLSCGNGQFFLYEMWLILELRIFYGYIVTGIFFLLLASMFGISKNLKKTEDMLSGKGADFLEAYREAQIDFSLSSFELFVTIILFIESGSGHGGLDNQNKGTYLASMILCLFYSIVTLTHSFGMFFFKDKINPWCGFGGQIAVSLLRFGLLATSLACFFT